MIPSYAKCLRTYQVGRLHKPPAREDVQSPYIRITLFSGRGASITVGNESQPEHKNHAVVTGLEYAENDGVTGKIHLHDQEGSSTARLMQNLLFDMRCVQGSSEVFAELEWGWIYNDHISGGRLETTKTNGFRYFVLIREIEAVPEAGKIHYTLHFVDMLYTSDEARIDKVYGKSGDGAVSFRSAVKEMLTDDDYKPSIKTVLFRRVGASQKKDGRQGFQDILKFERPDGAPSQEGYRGIWRGNNRSKLDCLIAWCSQVRTDRGKALVPTYCSDEKGGKVIIWEDPIPRNNENAIIDRNVSLGTYVVNGGKDSRVISFRPSFKFQAISGVKGGVLGAENVNSNIDTNAQNPGHTGKGLSYKENKSRGQEVYQPAVENLRDISGGTDPNLHTDRAMNAHAQAFAHLASIPPITADLEIIGEPSFPNRQNSFGKTISIIYINPFNIMTGSGGCGSWLAAPLCNEVLSNRGWRVQSVNHNIELGKYTTTIQLLLPAPGASLGTDKPLGASAEGWRPPTGCR